ncbi:MAG: hypothetical protein JWR80_4338 [Bradyrhizobium sp.]|nr:hypothetical protein [Bradyrhizobium sp.]
MSLAAAKSDLANIFVTPPSFDWADVLIGDDLKKFEKTVDLYERQALEWRSNIARQMEEGLRKFEVALGGIPEDEAKKVILEVTGSVLKALEESIATFSAPLHVNPEISSKVEFISKLSGSSGKFLRKLFRRIERIRVAQHTTSVDAYYGMLAFQSEHSGDAKGGKAFSDPQELGAFLRQHFAS